MDTNITNPGYNLLSASEFFGASDKIRIVILIYIFISLILNTINISTFIILRKKLKDNFLQSILNLSIIIVNFLHTFAYFFEWVIQKDGVSLTIENNNTIYKVGGLLMGNPNHFSTCTAQAFLLISSSLSQDILINVIFYMINHYGEFEELKIKLCAFFLGGLAPFLFTLIYYFIGALGLNDEFCYVTKFDFSIENNTVNYSYYSPFTVCVFIVYGLRLINFILTIKFMVEIIKFVKKNNLGFVYIRKTALLPTIQLITVFIGIIYRASIVIDHDLSASLSGIYLVLNTADGVLFPLAFAFNNSIFSWFKKIITGEIEEKKEEKLTEFLENEGQNEIK